MFDFLKRLAFKKIENLAKPMDRLSLAKDVAAASVRVTQLADSRFHFTDKLADAAFRHVGPASPGLINAADKVTRSRAAAQAVKYATEGGPLTKTFNTTFRATSKLVDKYHLDDRLLKHLPGPGSKASEPVTRKIAPRTMGPRSAPQQNPAPGGSSVLPGVPNLRLHLPKLGESLRSVRASSSSVMSDAAKRAFSLKHMTIRTAATSAGAGFSAKHMTIRNASPIRSNAFKMTQSRPAAKPMPGFRPSLAAAPKTAVPIKMKSMNAKAISAPKPKVVPKAPVIRRPVSPPVRGFKR